MASPKNSALTVEGDLAWARPHWEKMEANVTDYSLSPSGKRVLFSARGDVFSVDGEWDVENEGVAPNVEVKMTPKLLNQGHDPQLEKGVRQVSEMLKTQEVKLLTQPKDPVRW